MALGSPMSGYIADALGRKNALAIVFVFLTLGPLTMALAAGFKALFLGRILLGIGIGGGVDTVSTYLAEISPADVRGRLVGLEELFLVLGAFLGTLSNYFLVDVRSGWRIMLGLGALSPMILLGILASPAVLESPRWLLLQGRMEEAQDILQKLLRPAEARQALDEWTQQASQRAEPWMNVLRPADPRKRNALLSGIIVALLNAGSGGTIITTYLATFLDKEYGEGDHGLGIVVIFGIIRAVTVLFCLAFISDRWGRREMLLMSSIGTTIASAILMWAYSTGAAFVPYKFIGVCAIGVSHSMGLGPAAWPYMSEVCSTDVRSKSVSVMILLARMWAGLSIMSVPAILHSFDISGLFAYLLAFNFLGFLGMYLYVQETRGRSLESMGILVDKA
eukprot:CAMPEP_0170580042 /NCGR_PEP_ID=MMETSP0224-20130122/6301_1 /TAXON_ID=285029 /ORGANISM="Togula jolla, Strain CCCM 725" /LENGTH=391 /DNA_ID=CAMNT_0010903097 /DNA_START=278 /DNA_END=1453 /DNA_ORIENTATION=+